MKSRTMETALAICLLMIGSRMNGITASIANVNPNNVLDSTNIAAGGPYDRQELTNKGRKKHTITDDSKNTTISWFTLEIYKFEGSETTEVELDSIKDSATSVLNEAMSWHFIAFQEFRFDIENVELIFRPYAEPDSNGNRRARRGYRSGGISRDLLSEDTNTSMEPGVAVTFSGKTLFFMQPSESQNRIDKQIIKSVNEELNVNTDLIARLQSSGIPNLVDVYEVKAVPYQSEAPSMFPSSEPTSLPTVISSVEPTVAPSIEPSIKPSILSSTRPSVNPSSQPTVTSSIAPSHLPSVNLSAPPSNMPLSSPSFEPTIWKPIVVTVADISTIVDPLPIDNNSIIYTGVAIGAAFVLIFALFVRRSRRDDDTVDRVKETSSIGADDLEDDMLYPSKKSTESQGNNIFATPNWGGGDAFVEGSSSRPMHGSTHSASSSAQNSGSLIYNNEENLLGAFPVVPPNADKGEFKNNSLRDPLNRIESDYSWDGESVTSDQDSLMRWNSFKRQRHLNPSSVSIMSSNASSAVSSSVGGGSSFAMTNTTTSTKSSKKLINDLVWLEKRISDVRNTDSTIAFDRETVISPIMQNIVCKNCYAPPGKLNIIIQSTRDGPTIYSVYDTSSLAGQLVEGDLIIAVDNVDTRSMSADEVMKLMQSRSKYRRKITVLHFDD